MKPRALVSLFSILFAVPGVSAEPQASYGGLELTVLGAERVSVYRDLKVKNDKKEQLLVVRLEVHWTAETRYILIEDQDLRVGDAGGKAYRSALTFVQATAAPGDASAVLEIPFRVKADATIVTLRVGKALLPIRSGPSAN